MESLAVGIIEGVAEATALIARVVSGALSDRLGMRKRLAAAGYGLAAITKPIFALAPTVGWLVRRWRMSGFCPPWGDRWGNATGADGHVSPAWGRAWLPFGSF